MKTKKIFTYLIFSVLILFAIGLYINFTTSKLISARYKYDGRLINPESVGSTQLVNGDVANVDLATTAVDGGVMYEATRYAWFGATGDDSTGMGLKPDATNPPTLELFGTAGTCQLWTMGFDADGGSTGDDVAYLTFVCPNDYEANSMELYLYWFHLDDNGAATDSVEWVGTCNAVASGEDIMVAGTAITAVYTMAVQSDSALYITNLDPEVEDITAGDLVTIEISVDESDSQLDTGELAHLIGILVTWEAVDN